MKAVKWKIFLDFYLMMVKSGGGVQARAGPVQSQRSVD